MRHCVVVLLSKTTIELFYNEEDTSFGLTPWQEQSERPLAVTISDSEIQVGNKFDLQNALSSNPDSLYNLFDLQGRTIKVGGVDHDITKLPFLAIKEFIRRFFLDIHKENMMTIKDDINIILLFNVNVEKNKRRELVEDFKKDNFGNVISVDYDECLISNLKKSGFCKDYVVTVTNDSQNIIINSYIEKTLAYKSGKTFCNLGKDPRVSLCAKEIWTSISNKARISYPENQEKIESIAREFLNSSHSELAQEIVLSDGKEHDVFVSRSIINKNDANAFEIQKQINAFCRTVTEQRAASNIDVIVKEDINNRGYITSAINSIFPSLKTIEQEDKLIFIKSLYDDLKSFSYDLRKVGKYKGDSTEDDAYNQWINKRDEIEELAEKINESFEFIEEVVSPYIKSANQIYDKWMSLMKEHKFSNAKNSISSLTLSVDGSKIEEITQLITQWKAFSYITSHINSINNVSDNIISAHQKIDDLQNILADFKEKSVAMRELDSKTEHFKVCYSTYLNKIEELRNEVSLIKKRKILSELSSLTLADLPVIEIVDCKGTISAQIVKEGGFMGLGSKKYLHVRVKSDIPLPCDGTLYISSQMLTSIPESESNIITTDVEKEKSGVVVDKKFLVDEIKSRLGKVSKIYLRFWPHKKECVSINKFIFQGLDIDL